MKEWRSSAHNGMQSVTITQRILLAGFKVITRFICRIDACQLAKVPLRGPLIVVINHVNILEIPILYTQMMPRPFTALVAAHRWEVGWSRWLLETFDAIPVRRGEPDLSALRKGMAALKAGYILAVAPEGTRSGSGILQKGHPGVVVLGVHSGAPLLPVVFYGAETYLHNLKRLRRTDFHIAVGSSFYLDTGGEKLTREVRKKVIREVMYQLAALLPPSYRGAYANPDAATRQYVRFQELN